MIHNMIQEIYWCMLRYEGIKWHKKTLNHYNLGFYIHINICKFI